MKAEIELGIKTINIIIDEDLSQPIMLRWCIYHPEEDKYPSLALDLLKGGVECTLFSKKLDENGKKISCQIIERFLENKSCYLVMPTKTYKHNVNRRHEISSLDRILEKIRITNPI